MDRFQAEFANSTQYVAIVYYINSEYSYFLSALENNPKKNTHDM